MGRFDKLIESCTCTPDEPGVLSPKERRALKTVDKDGDGTPNELNKPEPEPEPEPEPKPKPAPPAAEPGVPEAAKPEPGDDEQDDEPEEKEEAVGRFDKLVAEGCGKPHDDKPDDDDDDDDDDGDEQEESASRFDALVGLTEGAGMIMRVNEGRREVEAAQKLAKKKGEKAISRRLDAARAHLVAAVSEEEGIFSSRGDAELVLGEGGVTLAEAADSSRAINQHALAASAALRDLASDFKRLRLGSVEQSRFDRRFKKAKNALAQIMKLSEDEDIVAIGGHALTEAKKGSLRALKTKVWMVPPGREDDAVLVAAFRSKGDAHLFKDTKKDSPLVKSGGGFLVEDGGSALAEDEQGGAVSVRVDGNLHMTAGSRLSAGKPPADAHVIDLSGLTEEEALAALERAKAELIERAAQVAQDPPADVLDEWEQSVAEGGPATTKAHALSKKLPTQG